MPGPSAHHHTIETVAHEAGVTVRNIRYYQSLGLISPPERRGRSSVYADEHIAQLRRIRELRSRGFSLEAIRQLLSSSTDDTLLSLARRLLEGLHDEPPQIVAAEDLARRRGAEITPELASRTLATSFYHARDDGTIEIRSPTLEHVDDELKALHVPLAHTIDTLEIMDEHLGKIARAFVDIYVHHVWQHHANDTNESLMQALRDSLQKLQPLAAASVAAAFAVVIRDQAATAIERELSRREIEQTG